jgi:hypothetical protein
VIVPVSRFGFWRTFARLPGGRALRSLAVLAGLGLALGARAHDPFEITTAARVAADGLVLEVTMARSTALAVAAGGRESPTFDPAEFDRHRTQLLAAAPALFAINSAGRALVPRDAQVQLGIEQDVAFRLVYPRPANGVVKIVASHLPQLGGGYGNVLTLRGGGLEAEKLLTASDAAFEWTMPAVRLEPNQARRLTRLGIATAAVVMVIVLAWWSDRRPQPGLTSS